MTALNKDFNPATLDLYIDQRDDFYKVVSLSINEEPLDLSWFTFSANLREYYNTSKDYNLSVSVLGNPFNGQILLTMGTLDTSLLVKPRYVYSVRGVSDTETVRVLSGQVLVSPVA